MVPMNPLFSGMGGLDPSKMNPQTIAALTELMGTLTHEQMMKMQSIMHNSMAGFDVAQAMAEFEKTLPSSFKEKMAKIMYMANGIDVGGGTNVAAAPAPSVPPKAPQNMTEARLVILQSVSQGLMTPEQAVKVLFPDAE